MVKLVEPAASADDHDALRRHEDAAFIVLTVVIGAVVGLVVSAFIVVTETLGAALLPETSSPWRRLLVPTAGALITGTLLARVVPAARGSGIPQTKTALELHDGFISLRTAVGKFFCSSLSLASGIALGREGPSVQVGSGIASVLGQRLGVGPSRLRRLVPVGASAAVAAAFNTPVAAVLFTLEEVVGNLHAPVIGSIVLSSATAWMVMRSLLGDEPLFHVPAYHLVHPIEFVLYAVLGLAGGLVSVTFVKLLLGLRARFRRLPARTVWGQPAIGGLLIGLVGMLVPAVLGVGYNHVGEALNGRMALGAMALLLGLKLMATAVGYASGNAGGIFGPSLFLGAMLGGTVGSIGHGWLPDYTAGAGTYALVGMGAAFAGIIRVPFTSVVMIFEITRDYTIVVPVMIANLISYFVSARLQPEPIYEALLHQDGVRLPNRREPQDSGLVVGTAMEPPDLEFAPDETLGRVSARVAEAPPPAASSRAPEETDRRPLGWPVVRGDTFAGWLTPPQLADAVRRFGPDARLADVPGLVPPDGEHPPHVHPDDSLDRTLRRMADSQLAMLPVIGRTEPASLLGVVSFAGIVRTYRSVRPLSDREDDDAPRVPARTFLFRLAAVVTLLLALSGWFAYRYRVERAAQARQALRTGQSLAAQQRWSEAIEQMRVALAGTGDNEARVALADALLALGRRDEAEIYFREAARTDPASGPAQLGLARSAAARGDIEGAALAYGRAVSGNWPEDPAGRRRTTHLEFSDALARAGRADQAMAQLLEIDLPPGTPPAFRLIVGNRFLTAGDAARAATIFASLAAADPSLAAAHAGLGEARLARGDDRRALDAFRQAARLSPADGHIRQRVRQCEWLLTADPKAARLSSSQRYERSRTLLRTVVDQTAACAAAGGSDAAATALQARLAVAQRQLSEKGRPASFQDATDAATDLAAELWQARPAACAGGDLSDALDLLLRRLQR